MIQLERVDRKTAEAHPDGAFVCANDAYGEPAIVYVLGARAMTLAERAAIAAAEAWADCSAPDAFTQLAKSISALRESRKPKPRFTEKDREITDAATGACYSAGGASSAYGLTNLLNELHDKATK